MVIVLAGRYAMLGDGFLKAIHFRWRLWVELSRRSGPAEADAHYDSSG